MLIITFWNSILLENSQYQNLIEFLMCFKENIQNNFSREKTEMFNDYLINIIKLGINFGLQQIFEGKNIK